MKPLPQLMIIGAMLCLMIACAVTQPAHGQTNQEKYDKATQLFVEGTKLAEAGTAESMQASLPKFEQARRLAREINAQQEEAFCLIWLGETNYFLGYKQQALKFYNEALPLLRAVGDKGSEARTLNYIGVVYNDLGEKQQALKFYNEALPLRRAVGDKDGEAQTLNSMGVVYRDLGEKQQALKLYDQALPLSRAVGNKRIEAVILNNIGTVYFDLGENQEALKLYNEALSLLLTVGDIRSQAYLLTSIGAIYRDLGDKQQALKFYNQALPLSRRVGDKGGEAQTLNHIGLVYSDLGENQQALKFYNEALPLRRAVGDRSGEASTLNSMGAVYSALGERQQALKFYNEALPLRRAVGDRNGEASTLNNIGKVYGDLGKQQQALKYFNESLLLLRAIGNKVNEAVTLNNIGLIYNDLGERQQALKLFNEALLLHRAVGDKSGEATTLNNIGTFYADLNEARQALKFFNESLPLLRADGDKHREAITLSNIFMSLVSSNPRFSVFYGKQSVNNFQTLRLNVRGLDKDIQQMFLKSIEVSYRFLTDALITQGRYAEAQQILNTFKDQQYFDFNSNKQTAPLTLTAREGKLVAAFNQKLERIVASIRQLDDYKRTNGKREPTKSEAAQIQIYEANLKAANADYSAFLKQAETDFSQPLSSKDKVGEIADTRKMQTVLRDLQSQTGQKAATIYTLEAQENYRGLLITPDKIVTFSYPIKAAELKQKAVKFFEQLSEIDKQKNVPKFSESEVKKTGKELYDIMFAPVAAKLKELNINPDVVMWSLDGTLRYIPVAALYDGKQYLAERYRQVIFTRADSERMLAPVSPIWTGSGFYNSKEYSLPVRDSADGKMKLVRFDGLKNAKMEVETIFGISPKQSIIVGEFKSNDEFTKELLLKALKLNRPLVHIASHFKFEAGDANSSFLLLGDGNKLTLEDIKNAPDDLFKGVELLTLSACETGVQKERESDGREIDSFAELAQRKGAKAVIASLWKVDDESTSQLMTQFYETRQTQKITKAEALQKAQLSLLKSKDYSHPYYWSPFILIGNWK
jgi:CHAT domain-containing protein/Flp pilus assembly protein TadD